MAKITEAAMRDAREGLDTGDAGAREKATRALRFWAMERTEENIELYLALKVSVQRHGVHWRSPETYDGHLEGQN